MAYYQQKCEERDLLFAVLRAALWNGGHSDELYRVIDSESAIKVLDESRRQAVQGIVFDALSKSGVILPSQVVLSEYGMMQSIRRRNSYVDSVISEFVSVMDSIGIEYVMMKGQSVGTYYPDGQLRVSGDVDFYCDADNFARAERELPNALGVVIDDENARLHKMFEFKGVHFEMHFKLFHFYDKRLDGEWENIVSSDTGGSFMCGETAVRTFSPTLHAFFLFLHIYKHLMELGIGIRQFCDFAVFLHAMKDQIDYVRLCEWLDKFGMMTAFRACGCIVTDCLGLPTDDLPVSLDERDRHNAKGILAVVFHRGNMGKYNKIGGFSGLLHNIEAMFIKLSHFMRFYSLAPMFNRKWLMNMSGRIKVKLGL